MQLPEVLLVTKPSADFREFLIACKEVLGYSPSRAADASARDLSEAETFLTYLAAFRDQQARVGPVPNPNLLSHVSFSVFVIARERHLFNILERCAGMPFVTTETTDRAILAAVVTGTLAQWRDAVAAGCVREAEPPVRLGFRKIYNLFHGMNLNVWSDYNKREAADGTLLLEEKTRR